MQEKLPPPPHAVHPLITAVHSTVIDTEQIFGTNRAKIRNFKGLN